MAYDSLFYSRRDDATWQYALGRYAEPAYRFLTGNQLALPWITSVLTLLYCGITALIISKCLSTISRLGKLLIGVILVTCEPLTVLLATFTAFADGQAFSMLLAALAAWCWQSQHTTYGTVASSVLLAVSIAIYQAYVAFFVGLVMVCVVVDLLNGEPKRAVIKAIVTSVFITVVAFALYVAGLRISLWITGTTLYVGENGIAGFGASSFAEYVSLFGAAWRKTLGFFFSRGPFTTRLVQSANVLLGLFTIVGVIRTGIKNRLNRSRIIVCLLILLMLPLAVNMSYILAKGSTYELMETAFVLLYLPAVCFIDQIFNRHNASNVEISIRYHIPIVAALLSFAIIGWNGMVFAQGLYGLRQFDYQGTVSTLTRIIGRIEQIDEYQVGKTPVFIVGRLEANPLGQNLPKAFDRYNSLMFSRSRAAGLSVAYQQHYRIFFETVLDYPIDLHCSEYEPAFVDNTTRDKIAKMSSYPAPDSCEYLNGVIVVKLSDEQ